MTDKEIKKLLAKEGKKLTTKLKMAIDYMVAHPFFTKSEVDKYCEMTSGTCARWMKSPIFLEAWDKQLSSIWKDSIRSALIKMAELASSGDYRANEFILKSGGFNDSTKLEIDSKKIVVSIEDDKE